MNSIKSFRTFLFVFFEICVVLATHSNGLDGNSTDLQKPLNGMSTGNVADMPQHAFVGTKRCMDELGCFEITEDFFHLLYRPLNFLPNDRYLIDTQFQLYTRQNPKEYWTLSASNLEGIKKSPFNKNHPTRFIVHGFLDNKWYGKWMEVMKDNLLLHSDNNVIIVDWSGGNSLPYTQATANTRVVGAEIALLINRLKEVKNVSESDCHIIGHSLGAHVAGYAGERIKKLGRISGIDPAEPFFQNMPPTVRLDPTDADFVDVIHTDSVSILFFGLGMAQPVGHVDFYPNNGRDQPGCKADAIRSLFLDGLVEATRRFTSCSHQRAVDFYIYSINYRRAPPVGYHCQSWQNYTNGLCTSCGEDGSKCAVMGFRADEFRKHKNDSQSVKLYLSTSGIAPYWVFHYKVAIKFYNPTGGAYDQKGRVIMNFQGKYGDLETQLPDQESQAITFVHGQKYEFVVHAMQYLGSFEKMTLSWQSSSFFSFFKSKKIYVEYVEIVPLNTADVTERKKRSKLFCDDPKTGIKARQTVTLPSCSKSRSIEAKS